MNSNINFFIIIFIILGMLYYCLNNNNYNYNSDNNNNNNNNNKNNTNENWLNYKNLSYGNWETKKLQIIIIEEMSLENHIDGLCV